MTDSLDVLDLANGPIRQKYVEERPLFRRWFIFGEQPDTGRCDVADTEGDVIVNAPKPVALRIVAARDAFLDAVEAELATL